jgi:diguanylate cyclase (GGDEF)-like protein/hemerythrin-like metal-binding protein/PAS domain S-box-containing protein
MQTRAKGGEITNGNAVGKTLSKDQEKFHVAFEFANIGIGLTDRRGKFFSVNKKLSEMFGIAKEQLEGMYLQDLPVSERETKLRAPRKLALGGDGPQQAIEKRFVTGQGDEMWVEATFVEARDPTGKLICFIASFHDITERKALQTMLERQALDPLTKALNRTRFEERAQVELQRSERHGYGLSMVMADLDHFKDVNDTYGHAAGDLVLSTFCNIVRSRLRSMDLLGRWGGEEFLILLPDTGPAGARRVSERIRASLDSFTFANGAHVTASLGVAGLRAGESFSSLLERADSAMYQAKQNGRNLVFVDAEDLYWEPVGRPDFPRFLELTWKKQYSCGVRVIDDEHRRLFEIANTILSSMGLNGDGADVPSLVDALLAHIEEHFVHEEQWMESVKFPEIESHKELHRRLMAQAGYLVARFKRGETTVGALLGFVVRDVVAAHMLQEDLKYFPYAKIGQRRKRKPGHPPASS